MFRRCPKTSKVFQSLRTRINASLLPVFFTSKIRDREGGIVIYSFFTWFSFLTWVWVNIFLEIVSSKMETPHIFQSGVRNWPASMSRHEIEVFSPQAWDSRLRREIRVGRYNLTPSPQPSPFQTHPCISCLLIDVTRWYKGKLGDLECLTSIRVLALT